LYFLKKGHAHQFYEACQVERSEKADGLPPRMFMACPKPKFLNAAEITAAKDPVCSLKNILMVVYKVHCEAVTYTLSTQAADQFSDYFTEFRTNVELAYKKDSCIRLGYNKYKLLNLFLKKLNLLKCNLWQGANTAFKIKWNSSSFTRCF